MRLHLLTAALLSHAIALMGILSAPAGAAARVSSGDGLALSLSSRGEVSGLSLDGKAIRLQAPGGFFLAGGIPERQAGAAVGGQAETSPLLAGSVVQAQTRAAII